MTDRKKNSECLICGSLNLRQLKGYERHGLLKCNKCKFVFMDRIPTPEELDAYYSTYSYGREQILSPITIISFNKLLDEFEKFRKTNKILDVGCGMGWFLSEAQKRGWEVYGSEFSKKAVQICTDNGIRMQEGVLDISKFDTSDFDIITLFEVIEHINNPNELLKSIHYLLRKNGLFYCTTPNFNSLLRYYLKADYNLIGYPEHLSYYTKNTLNKVVSNNSLKPIKFLSTGISIDRFKKSVKHVEKPVINKPVQKEKAKELSDEKLRVNIENKWYLSIAKIVINKLLTLSNTGMALKGYYLKK